MKKSLFMLLCTMAIISCSTVDKTELYGHWKNNTWEFEFFENSKCNMGRTGSMKSNLKYSLLGNSLEISENGKVIVSGLTIKSVKGDSLFLQFRNLVGSGDQMDNDQLLLRQK